MKFSLFICSFFVSALSTNLYAQFPGPVGTPGSTAIYKDSSIFLSWANSCVINRGFMDIADANAGLASFGDDINGTLQAGVNGVVSLGDGGSAILTFPNGISNKPGFDFAVFENAFNDQFLELAFVEVSSDGVNYYRFPSISNTPNLAQIGPFDNSNEASLIHNLAGKYKANYGTPFDLSDLDSIIGLNLNAITHVKLIDVIGTINPIFTSLDSEGNSINDPYPTPFASSGFDLDAVGVINEGNLSISNDNEVEWNMYPNPISVNEKLKFSNVLGIQNIAVTNQNGQLIYQGNIDNLNITNFKSGVYFVRIVRKDHISIKKLFIQ